MGFLIVVIGFITLIFLSYLFFRNRNDHIQLPPHKIFPEIVAWKKGDRISGPDINTWINYISVMENGMCLFTGEIESDRRTYNIRYVKSNLYNRSLNKRSDDTAFSDNDYMEFINDFQQEYDKIKDRNEVN